MVNANKILSCWGQGFSLFRQLSAETANKQELLEFYYDKLLNKNGQCR